MMYIKLGTINQQNVLPLTEINENNSLKRALSRAQRMTLAQAYLLASYCAF